MILCDTELRTKCETINILGPDIGLVSPIEEDQIQPASIDVRLGEEFKYFNKYEVSSPNEDIYFRALQNADSYLLAKRRGYVKQAELYENLVIDPENFNADKMMQSFTATKSNPFLLGPGDFALGHTLETITLPNNLVGIVNGKSSLGRLGLIVHATAGFVDPGFPGQVTLELYNLSPYAIILRPGMKIAQMVFQRCGSCENPYGSDKLNSKYKGQTGATASRISNG